jgi:DNA-binding NarL/FixJ family response regulator
LRRRVLVAVAHPTIAAGVVEVLRLDPDVDVLRVTADVAAARAHEWNADLILADADSARALRGLASIVMVTAAGDGIAARAAAQEIGAAGWLFVDEIDREIDRYFGRRSGATESRRARAVAMSVAVAAVASLAVALGLVWAALVP